MDRPTLETHLALHGWVPVGGADLADDGSGLGFGLRNDTTHQMLWYALPAGAYTVEWLTNNAPRRWALVNDKALHRFAALIEKIDKLEEKYGNKTHVGAGARVGTGP